jgi:hypothetical protein
MRLGMLVIAMTVLLGTTVSWAKAPRARTAATCGGKLIASLPIKNDIWARADLGTAGDKRIITVETDRKYRARYCG